MLLGYFAYYVVVMTWKSFIYGDVSTNLVAIPLWIPQLAMAAGAVTLTLAIADEFIWVLGGHKPHYEEATRRSRAAARDRIGRRRDIRSEGHPPAAPDR